MSLPTVFLLDDDLETEDSYRIPLTRSGMELRTCRDAEQLFTNLSSGATGCVVLGATRVEPGHLDIIERLKELANGLSVILCAAHADVPDCVRAFRAGADDFLQKPIDEQELVERVRVAVAPERLDGANFSSDSGTADPEIQGRLDRLTPRERDVMELLMEGKVTKQVAAELRISFQTAAKHRARIHRKMKVASDSQLVRLLLTQGDGLKWHAASRTEGEVHG